MNYQFISTNLYTNNNNNNNNQYCRLCRDTNANHTEHNCPYRRHAAIASATRSRACRALGCTSCPLGKKHHCSTCGDGDADHRSKNCPLLNSGITYVQNQPAHVVISQPVQNSPVLVRHGPRFVNNPQTVHINNPQTVHVAHHQGVVFMQPQPQPQPQRIGFYQAQTQQPQPQRIGFYQAHTQQPQRIGFYQARQQPQPPPSNGTVFVFAPHH